GDFGNNHGLPIGNIDLCSSNCCSIIRHKLTTERTYFPYSARYITAGDGRIYIATSSGLCVMNKHILTQQKIINAPQTYFKSITINGNNQNERTVLASYNDDITVNFTAITFDQPDKILYQYNLTGKENGWIETKNTTAILSSLTPGNYTFSLRAKKYDSDWSNPIHFQLDIEPPYWQRWWFRGILITILAIGAYYLIKYITGRNYRIKLREVKAQQALAEERNRISSDMHDDLGADLSNILMLTRISNQSNKNEPLKNKQLSEIEQFTTRLIGKVDEIIWALNPNQDSLQDLVDYINDYCGQFLDHAFLKGKINIPYPVPNKNITAVFRRNIFLVIKEGINNIIKHSGATSFSLELKFDGGQVDITLQDDGKGFLDNDKLERGNGLINMQKRIKQLGGEIDIRSVPGNGTVLNIRVPIS
ncbi:MAG: triple tyrosine motif-containing protein, partial [Chitinophagales bacterium]